jgi:hypothetical protein
LYNLNKSAYISLVCPIPEYRVACWDPYREGQINVLLQAHTKAAPFTHHTKYSDWETLIQRRSIARLCALFKAYSGKRAWKVTRNKLRRPYSLSGVEHCRKKGTESRETILENILFRE